MCRRTYSAYEFDDEQLKVLQDEEDHNADEDLLGGERVRVLKHGGRLLERAAHARVVQDRRRVIVPAAAIHRCTASGYS